MFMGTRYQLTTETQMSSVQSTVNLEIWDLSPTKNTDSFQTLFDGAYPN